MNLINDEKDRRKIEELVATNRLLTDLTEAGSWTINFAPDGSVASVQWGDGLRRLLGYTDLRDFPNELESFMRGIHPEDRDAFIGGIRASILDENITRTAGYDCRYFKKDGSVRWFRSKGMLSHRLDNHIRKMMHIDNHICDPTIHHFIQSIVQQCFPLIFHQSFRSVSRKRIQPCAQTRRKNKTSNVHSTICIYESAKVTKRC